MEVNCNIYTATNSRLVNPNNEPILPQEYEITELKMATGQTIIVTGPNGVGKSALLSEIARSFDSGDIIETFFGNRHVSFDTENVDQIEQSQEQLGQQLRQSTTRYRQPYRDQQLKSVVRRTIISQTQSAQNVIQMAKAGCEIEIALSRHPQILDTINGVFKSALLPIEILLQEGTLKAKRGSAEYGIDRLSDGERAALLVAGAVLVRPSNTFIIVDEPERHLNPAISGPLLSALLRARPDLGFIFATHDLDLIQWLRPDKVIHVRDSLVVEPHSEKRLFDLSILESENDLPDELKYAILGSRRKLLLVEGAQTSEDQALYSHLYPDWNVVARGGWKTVSDSVRSLRGNHEYHWLTVAGIIDRDGRNKHERSQLAASKIFCLPAPTIENLFLHPVALEKMADAQHEFKGGDAASTLLENLRGQLPELLNSSRPEIIHRRLVWEGNRQLSEQKLSVKSVRDGQISIPEIDLRPLRVSIENEFDAALVSLDALAVLQKVPIKNTAIPETAAKILGFADFKEYKRTVLRQIETGSERGIIIRKTLQSVMPPLEES